MPEMRGGGAEKVLVDILKNIDYEIFDVSLLLEFKGNVYWSDIPKQVNVYCLNGENTLNMQRFHRALRILHCYGIFISIYYRACWKLFYYTYVLYHYKATRSTFTIYDLYR